LIHCLDKNTFAVHRARQCVVHAAAGRQSAQALQPPTAHLLKQHKTLHSHPTQPRGQLSCLSTASTLQQSVQGTECIIVVLWLTKGVQRVSTSRSP